MYTKNFILFAVAATGTSAHVLAERAFQPRDTAANGGWSLQSSTKVDGLVSCGSGAYCPADFTCSAATQSVAAVCCPSGSSNCIGAVEGAPVCADSSWDLYKNNQGNGFCCTGGQVGILASGSTGAGSCVDSVSGSQSSAQFVSSGSGSASTAAPSTSATTIASASAATTAASASTAVATGASTASGSASSSKTSTSSSSSSSSTSAANSTTSNGTSTSGTSSPSATGNSGAMQNGAVSGFAVLVGGLALAFAL